MATHDQMMELSAADIHTEQFGNVIRIRRQDNVTETFTAAWSNHNYFVIGADLGFPQKIQFRDWVLPQKNCKFDGVDFEPQAGDVIEIAHSGEEFRISPPDNNTPAVENHVGDFRYMAHSLRVKQRTKKEENKTAPDPRRPHSPLSQ